MNTQSHVFQHWCLLQYKEEEVAFFPLWPGAPDLIPQLNCVDSGDIYEGCRQVSSASKAPIPSFSLLMFPGWKVSATMALVALRCWGQWWTCSPPASLQPLQWHQPLSFWLSLMDRASAPSQVASHFSHLEQQCSKRCSLSSFAALWPPITHTSPLSAHVNPPLRKLGDMKKRYQEGHRRCCI